MSMVSLKKRLYMKELRQHNIVDYLSLTSPGITLLVVLTGFTGMLLASRGTANPLPPSLFLWTLLSIGLASAGSSVLNNWYDSDIDCLMKRTANRPLPEGRIDKNKAFFLGIIFIILAVVALILFVNLMAAFLTVLSIFVYSYLYTVILKRRSPLATEIGGISGALPPLIGWVAVRESLSLEAFILFSIIFLWQPPHFWSLASRYKEDYEKAGIPTMPVIASKDEIILRSLIYVASLFMASLMPYFIGMSGKVYLALSLSLGIIYHLLYLASLFVKRDLNRLLFFYSITYLLVIFTLLSID
ncbi:MAG: heme o synthase [Thermodesulfovibrionales bacterium]